MSQRNNLYRQTWLVERQLNQSDTPYHRIGHDGWPDQELVRFTSSQRLGFAGVDMAQSPSYHDKDGFTAMQLSINCLGLTGTRGVMPSHYSELVLNQVKSKSPQLRDFLDIFNHRLMSLLYRSWEKTQPAIHQERKEADIFSTVLNALTGAKQHWLLMYGAALSRTACSASTLSAALKHLTGIDAHILSLQGGWRDVALDDQTQLPSRAQATGRNAYLGDAMLGSKAWIADLGITVTFKPKSLDEVSSLLPGGRFSQAIDQLVGALAGKQLAVGYQITTLANNLSGSYLGRQAQLGINTFTTVKQPTQTPITVRFKPTKG